MKNILIKIVLSLILLTSIRAKSQLIDASMVASYDPSNNFYVFKQKASLQNADIFSSTARKAGGNDLRLQKSFKDEKGNKHNKYLQYYKHILVEGTEFIVHSTADNLPQTANGKMYENIDINTTASVLPKQKQWY